MNPLGAILVAAALALVAGCATPDWIERTLVTVDVTGAWEGITSRGTVYRLDLEQSDARVKGAARRTVGGGVGTGVYSHANAPGPLEGTVSGDVFSFKDPGSNFSGRLTVSGDQMAGDITDPLGPGVVTLRRTSASLPSKQ